MVPPQGVTGSLVFLCHEGARSAKTDWTWTFVLVLRSCGSLCDIIIMIWCSDGGRRLWLQKIISWICSSGWRQSFAWRFSCLSSCPAAALMSFSTSSAANRTRWKVWGVSAETSGDSFIIVSIVKLHRSNKTDIRKVSFLPTRLILSLHQFYVDDSCSDDVMEAEIKTKKGKRAGNWKIPRFDLYAFWGPLSPHSMQGQVCIDSLNNWSHCKKNPSWFWRGRRGAVLGFDWLHVDRSCRYHT